MFTDDKQNPAGVVSESLCVTTVCERFLLIVVFHSKTYYVCIRVCVVLIEAAYSIPPLFFSISKCSLRVFWLLADAWTSAVEGGKHFASVKCPA